MPEVVLVGHEPEVDTAAKLAVGLHRLQYR